MMYVVTEARMTPEMESTEDVRMAMGAGKLRNSVSSTPKTSASIASLDSTVPFSQLKPAM